MCDIIEECLFLLVALIRIGAVVDAFESQGCKVINSRTFRSGVFNNRSRFAGKSIRKILS